MTNTLSILPLITIPKMYLCSNKHYQLITLSLTLPIINQSLLLPILYIYLDSLSTRITLAGSTLTL